MHGGSKAGQGNCYSHEYEGLKAAFSGRRYAHMAVTSTGPGGFMVFVV